MDPRVALPGDIGQIVLEAHNAVVGGAIRALFGTVLFSNSSRLIFTLSERVAEVFNRMAMLVGEQTGLSVTQHVRKMYKSCFELSAIELAI
ncbi:hypothetical protein ACTXG5_17505 [Mycobacterium sp. Dal123C01]|uniref:hypothetical protein n=1 Tax=Mycobacterium sp. Dal123C01 TaxID=3457577 RepID=UPI00403E69C0